MPGGVTWLCVACGLEEATAQVTSQASGFRGSPVGTHLTFLLKETLVRSHFYRGYSGPGTGVAF